MRCTAGSVIGWCWPASGARLLHEGGCIQLHAPHQVPPSLNTTNPARRRRCPPLSARPPSGSARAPRAQERGGWPGAATPRAPKGQQPAGVGGGSSRWGGPMQQSAGAARGAAHRHAGTGWAARPAQIAPCIQQSSQTEREPAAPPANGTTRVNAAPRSPAERFDLTSTPRPPSLPRPRTCWACVCARPRRTHWWARKPEGGRPGRAARRRLQGGRGASGARLRPMRQIAQPLRKSN
jgi:hypothetical protein